MQLPTEKILLDQFYQNWKKVLTEVGRWITQQGGIKPAYVRPMVEGQEKAGVYIGNLIALPHGTNKDEEVVEEGIYLAQMLGDADLGTREKPKVATLLLTMALKEEHQLAALQGLTFFCPDIDRVMVLSDAGTIEEIQVIFGYEHI